MPVTQIKQQIHHLRTIGLIEIAGGFVCQEDLGPRHHRTGQRHPLLFATGHLRGHMIAAMAQPHGLQFLAGALKRITRASQFQRCGDIFQRRHRRDQVKALKHHPHMGAAEPGQGVLTQPGQILAHGAHAATCCLL